MRPETFLQAMEKIDPALLEDSDARAKKPKSRFSVRMVWIAAAVVLLLISSVAATKLGLYRRDMTDPNSYELFFVENPAAEDAPRDIAVYYTPEMDWEILRLDQIYLNDWRFHISWYTQEGGQIVFSQQPLARIYDGTSFDNNNGIGLDDLQQSSFMVGDTEVLSLFHESEFGRAEWLYWIDEEHHYIFSLFYNESISSKEAKRIFESIRPATQEELERYKAEAQRYQEQFLTKDGSDTE